MDSNCAAAMRIFVVVGLLPLVMTAVAAAQTPVGPMVPIEVVRVIDGDTVIVRRAESADEHVRLFAVDADELSSGSFDAFQAAAFLARTLENARTVWIETDPVALTDDFGRTLAWLWAEDSLGQGKLLNLTLIHEGLARYWPAAQSQFYAEDLRLAAARPAPHKHCLCAWCSEGKRNKLQTPLRFPEAAAAPETANWREWVELTDRGGRWTSANVYWIKTFSVRNTSAQFIPFITLRYTVYDSSDNVVASEMTIMKNLGSGHSKNAEFWLSREDTRLWSRAEVDVEIDL